MTKLSPQQLLQNFRNPQQLDPLTQAVKEVVAQKIGQLAQIANNPFAAGDGLTAGKLPMMNGALFPNAAPYQQMFNGAGLQQPVANAAADATLGAFKNPLEAFFGPKANLPFFNPLSGRLDAGRLSQGFQSFGMDPATSQLAGSLISNFISPQQFFQPLWNSLGGKGPVNLDQLGQFFGRNNAAPQDLQQQLKNQMNLGNQLPLQNQMRPRPAKPGANAPFANNPFDAKNPGAVQPPIGQPQNPIGQPQNPVGQPQNPVQPGQPGVGQPGVGQPGNPITPGTIDQNAQNNQQRILNRADAVVQELYGPGAKIVDNDQAGKKGQIDANDYIVGADGTKRVIGDKDFRDIQIRTHTIEGANILDQAQREGRGMGFVTDMNNPKFNNQFWENRNGRMTVRDGVSPSQAIDDVFRNPQLYGVDCAAAAHLVGLRAIKETIGAGDFDRSHGGLSIQGWDAQRAAGGPSLTDINGSTDQRAGGNPKPGDVGYFKNPDNVSAAWQGENVLYLGNGRYWGHPGGSKTGQEWVDWINQNARTPGATREAYLSSLVGQWGGAHWAGHDLNPFDSNAL